MARDIIEELKYLVEEERYEEAAALLPEVKERNAKTVSEMMAIAKILGKTGEWERSERLYLKAYKKRPSRLVLKEIMQMFIDCEMANEAENYYNQYIDLTPGDSITKLAAKYRIEKIRGTEHGYLISLLQQLKEVDYTEEYGYELCKQLYKINDEEGCRGECKELIENFPETKEAEKARRLLAVINGEISVEDIKKESGMASAQTSEKNIQEISTKELPTIEFSPEAEEGEKTERFIAESVKDIISEDTGETAKEENFPDTQELGELLKAEVEKTENTIDETDEIEAVTEADEVNEVDEVDGTDEVGRKDEIKGAQEASGIDEVSITKEISRNEETGKSAEDRGTAEDSKTSEASKIANAGESEDAVVTNKENESEQAEGTGLPKEPGKGKRHGSVPVRIYAPLYAPSYLLGKEDFADTRSRNVIADKNINIEGIFGQFFRNNSIRRQIYNSLELAYIDKGNSWIIVTGEEKTGRTYLAKKIMFCMFSMGILSTKKVAVTKAAVINRMTTEEIVGKIGVCNIIVEKATELTEEGIESLRNIKLNKEEKVCIVLEDTDNSISSFIKNVIPSGMSLSNRIHLPKYNTEDLLGFVYDYLKEKGYDMEKVAADLVVSCINSTRAQTQGERYMHALQVARQTAETADRRVAPDILKMAAEAAFQEYYSLTVIREDITP